MATDKKSDHFTAAEAYTDLDGQYKTFTTIDYDVKTKVKAGSNMTDDELTALKRELKTYQENQIEEILSLPAISFLSSGNFLAEEYIERHPEKGIIWRETMVRDALSINPDLARVFYQSTWKNTVKEIYWNEEMSHEDILAEKWREWI